MQPLEYAMQMEKDGETYYRGLAARNPDKGLASILTYLADAEVKHYNVLRDMQAKAAPTKLDEGTIRADIKNIFADLIARAVRIDATGSEINAFQKAQDLEQKTRDFYLEQSQKARVEAERKLLLQIADQELMHFQILGSIIEFVSRPLPGHWLENAEWHHPDEY